MTPAAFKNHSKGCEKNKKRFSSILTRAQELYSNKRHHLSSDEGVLQPRDASTRENLVPYEVRTNCNVLGHDAS